MSNYTGQYGQQMPPFDPSFVFSKVNMGDEDTGKPKDRTKEDNKREKHTKNKDKKKIINRAEGMLTTCPMCGNPILKKGEEGNNESFKAQLIVINDEETGVEQYTCGLCQKFMTLIVTKSRAKVFPQIQIAPE